MKKFTLLTLLLFISSCNTEVKIEDHESEFSSFFKSSTQKITIDWEKLYDLVSNVEAEVALKNGKLIAKKLQEDRLQVLENYLSKI